MAHEFARYEKQGRIAIVTINRPEQMNALHPPANVELHEIWNDFEQAQQQCGDDGGPARGLDDLLGPGPPAQPPAIWGMMNTSLSGAMGSSSVSW